MESLGEVHLEIRGLTLGKLEAQLHEHPMSLPGTQNSSRLGWFCGQLDCLIWASFVTTPNEPTSENAVPAMLMVSNPWGSLFGSRQRLTVGGAYLGEPTGKLLESAQKRNYGVKTADNQITWDK